jgi:hypothetical protein
MTLAIGQLPQWLSLYYGPYVDLANAGLHLIVQIRNYQRRVVIMFQYVSY